MTAAVSEGVASARTQDLLNRPMVHADLARIESNPWALGLRTMVEEYRNAGLPVMNGSFPFSNLMEGPSQILTSGPYRLWEYASLFLALGSRPVPRRFIDVGGAGAPLAYYLGELGWEGTAVDLQPMLIAMARYVAGARDLKIKADVKNIADLRADQNELVDVVTCISVLEHVPDRNRRELFEAVYRLLRSGGVFYLTFDYGAYEESDPYEHVRQTDDLSRSIGDVAPLCALLESCGFRIIGNDPRELPPDLLAAKEAPGRQHVMWQHAVTTRPFDAQTPWRTVAKYVANRLMGRFRRRRSRFDHHNFFRLFLEKP